MPKRATNRVAAVAAPEPDSRYDRRMAEVLAHATDVFYERGYEGASMRDLSRASGMSLAGLYHYIDSKEKLLFLIQRDAFTTIVERLRARLEGETDPIQRLRVFIGNHLEYFLANMKAMKVLSHEDDVLTGEHGQQVQAIKREYYRICLELVARAREASQGSAEGARSALQFPAAGNGSRRDLRNEHRPAVVILFGMMNWLYTWYNPRIDGDAAELTERMTQIFLHGVLSQAQAAAALPGKRQS